MYTNISALLDPGLVLVAFLAVLQASFQLATSVITLLSGHSLSKNLATNRLISLNLAFTFGAVSTTALFLIAMTYIGVLWVNSQTASQIWSGLILWACATSLLLMTSYYREGSGTRLWISRRFAKYLSLRAKRTHSSVEAGALGIISTIGELPFTGIVLAMSAFVMAYSVPADYHLAVALVYSIIACLPLIVITTLLAGGHRLSTIQRARESSKFFLQHAAGAGLLAAALYSFVYFMIAGDRL